MSPEHERRPLSRYLTILLFGLFLALAGCSGGEDGAAGPAGPTGPTGGTGPAGPAGEAASLDNLTCSECHDDSTLIAGKTAAWEESGHGSGGAFVRGTSASCAGCHSGGAFSERVAAGLNPDELESGDPNPTRQECRTCHQIHTSYTGADWSLETTDAVEIYAVDGLTYDGGDGNLCVNCHQPRRVIADAVDGMIEVTSTHWGPHHGPQSVMLLGEAGAGDVTGNPSSHYSLVEGTCVTCHMGENDDHSYAPDVAVCQSCHSGAEDFDIGGVQTEVQALLDELGAELVARGWLSENGADGHPVVDFVPEAEAAGLWNWIYIAHEDGSLGVHNPTYTKALLEAGLEAVGLR